ncbi:TonB C-terminal domain-containing protein [Comamonas sp. NLF-1-9]|nr:TonB family protein [Comamonas sp. NLF-1-9]QXL84503.1 TonB C-terminal domain-containing protein [Comamonas sp. NLF-1-9]
MPRLPRHLGTLQLALGISIAAHAALLTVRFVAPATFDRIFQDTPLEVILVNAKGEQPPEKAQAVAQSALAGGGEAARGRASSPLPYSALTSTGDDAQDAERQMEQLQQQQQQLLVQVRRQIASLPAPDPRQAAQSAEGRAQEQKRQQLVRLLAEIEKRINEENARPRKRYISPATREAVYALYYDRLRRKVEDKGTRNFPEAGGKKLYGELVMILTVNHDGSVLATEIVQGSGNALLDRRAQAIARAAGPFGAFNAQMRAQTDQLAMVARFKFTREQQLEAELREPQ